MTHLELKAKFNEWINLPNPPEKFPSQEMKATPEILEIAKIKATNLTQNTQTRIGGGEYHKSYWVYNIANQLFIGYDINEILPKFFLTKPELALTSKFGNALAYLQPLNKQS